jgi:hypothetical protein
MAVRGCIVVMALAACAAAGPARAGSPGLTCEPTSLTPDSTALTLTLPDPHGRELGVSTEHGFFYLAWDEHAGIEGATPRIQGFREARELTLDPRTLEGWHFHASDHAWRPIFTEPGRYTFVTADVLQTDAQPADTIPASRCIVEYRK